ncbi:MAG: NAD(P)H-binding protein, partial [Gemmatimonadetes bacterium]|nr:NAD(P)H-binding protein [Gemmatimonadota bacterium]
MSRVFLTGATGFVGGHVLRRLLEDGATTVTCLVRDPARLPAVDAAASPDDAESANPADRVRTVTGTLENPEAFADALADCDTVVHLAALTGKATEEEHFKASARGTEKLLAAAKAAGVGRFLFMSTIAVAYPEKRAYPYARAKEEAERLVRESGLDWMVLRPTVILGPGSGLWDKFLSLASAPAMPVFGSGKNAMQPVHVDDVALCVAAAVAGERLGDRTREFGGRDTLPMKEFVQRIRKAAKGKDGPAVH